MKAHVKQTSIQETYQIPSKGLIYKDQVVPSEFTLRAMTTFEEKIRLGSNNFFKTMSQIIKNCTISPEDIDINKLTLFDMQFLMYKLRIITYGSDYKINVRCPECGEESELIFNLDNLTIHEIDENEDNTTSADEPFKIGPLPRSGDTLGCKFLRVNDFDAIDKKVKLIKRDYPDYQGDPSYLKTMECEILTVNDETIPPFKLEKYVASMNAADARFFNNHYDKFTSGIGINLNVIDTCPKCLSNIEFELPMTSEFFRPTYNY